MLPYKKPLVTIFESIDLNFDRSVSLILLLLLIKMLLGGGDVQAQGAISLQDLQQAATAEEINLDNIPDHILQTLLDLEVMNADAQQILQVAEILAACEAIGETPAMEVGRVFNDRGEVEAIYIGEAGCADPSAAVTTIDLEGLTANMRMALRSVAIMQKGSMTQISMNDLLEALNLNLTDLLQITWNGTEPISNSPQRLTAPSNAADVENGLPTSTVEVSSSREILEELLKVMESEGLCRITQQPEIIEEESEGLVSGEVEISGIRYLVCLRPDDSAQPTSILDGTLMGEIKAVDGGAVLGNLMIRDEINKYVLEEGRYQVAIIPSQFQNATGSIEIGGNRGSNQLTVIILLTIIAALAAGSHFIYRRRRKKGEKPRLTNAQLHEGLSTYNRVYQRYHDLAAALNTDSASDIFKSDLEQASANLQKFLGNLAGLGEIARINKDQLMEHIESSVDEVETKEVNRILNTAVTAFNNPEEKGGLSRDLVESFVATMLPDRMRVDQSSKESVQKYNRQLEELVKVINHLRGNPGIGDLGYVNLPQHIQFQEQEPEKKYLIELTGFGENSKDEISLDQLVNELFQMTSILNLDQRTISSQSKDIEFVLNQLVNTDEDYRSIANKDSRHRNRLDADDDAVVVNITSSPISLRISRMREISVQVEVIVEEN